MPTDFIKHWQHRVAESDEAALKELHGHFCNRLFQLAMTIVRSRPMAEEIVVIRRSRSWATCFL